MSNLAPTGVNKILVEKYGYEWVKGKAWKPGTAPEPEISTLDVTPGPLPDWITPPPDDAMVTEALETLTNPITGEEFTVPTGGYTLNVAATTPTPEPEQPAAPIPEAKSTPSYPEPTGINKILVEKYGYEWVNGKAFAPGTAPEAEVSATAPAPAPSPAPAPVPTPEPSADPKSELTSLTEKIEELQASLAALQQKYEAALVRISELEGQDSTTNSDDAVSLPESPTTSPEPEPSLSHPLSDNFSVTSSFGTSIDEGSVSDPSGGSGKEISFTIMQTEPQIKSVYAAIVPVTGQTSDFWDNFWSNKIGGEPADQFALGSFENVEASNATLSFTLNADSEIEGDETFNFNVYEKNTDLPMGNDPIKTFTFTIIDDDNITPTPEPIPAPQPETDLAPASDIELTLAEVEGAPIGISKLLVENYGYSWIDGKYYSKGTAPEVDLDGDAIHTVTVSKVGNQNVFFIDGNSNPDFVVEAGKTYRFDQSDVSNTNHPLNFFSVAGSDVTAYVEVSGTAGTEGAYVELYFDTGDISNIDGPELSYYCEIHGITMGNDIEVGNIIT